MTVLWFTCWYIHIHYVNMQTIKYPRWRNFKRASVRSERSWLMRKPFARSSSWRKLCISCRDKWQPRSRWDLKVLFIVFYCFFYYCYCYLFDVCFLRFFLFWLQPKSFSYFLSGIRTSSLFIFIISHNPLLSFAQFFIPLFLTSFMFLLCRKGMNGNE